MPTFFIIHLSLIKELTWDLDSSRFECARHTPGPIQCTSYSEDGKEDARRFSRTRLFYPLPAILLERIAKNRKMVRVVWSTPEVPHLVAIQHAESVPRPDTARWMRCFI